MHITLLLKFYFCSNDTLNKSLGPAQPIQGNHLDLGQSNPTISYSPHFFLGGGGQALSLNGPSLTLAFIKASSSVDASVIAFFWLCRRSDFGHSTHTLTGRGGDWRGA